MSNKIIIPINNGFWKLFWHWLFKKKLRRQNTYTFSAFRQKSEVEDE